MIPSPRGSARAPIHQYFKGLLVSLCSAGKLLNENERDGWLGVIATAHTDSVSGEDTQWAERLSRRTPLSLKLYLDPSETVLRAATLARAGVFQPLRV